MKLDAFQQTWLVDFEFRAQSGERQEPICMVALEMRSGRLIRLWEGELRQLGRPPFLVDKNILYVAYYASAELQCHLSLGWPLPVNILDLFTEFRCMTNGLPVPCGAGLLGALSYHGLPAIEGLEKDAMRELALRGGPWTGEERDALLNYCESDVRALEKLLPVMLSKIDLPRALIRGKYMSAVATMEHRGVPIDQPAFLQLKDKWTEIREALVKKIDKNFNVYENNTFKMWRFEEYLMLNNIAWPRLSTGRLDMQDATFREMSRIHPQLNPLRELRHTLGQMRLTDLAVGADGRNRCLLSAFRSRTGRNQPSNSKFIFGPSTWLRGLIKPPEGHGLVYTDWSQQEFAIAAALSGDELMMDAYASGDPYMRFAIQAGLAPPGATKESHEHERDLCKACVLAVQYGMGASSLALRIDQPEIRARELLSLHRRTYKKYWDWSDGVQDYAMLHGKLWTTFAWELHVSTKTNNPRSLRNFPMQANGAEMLRLACIMLTDTGIGVVAPVHDALLIEAPLDRLDEDIARTQAIMRRAGEIVLSGFQLRSDAKVIRYPERFMDKRGEQMWCTVWSVVNELDVKGRTSATPPSHSCDPGPLLYN
ncbi:DNA polymerase [Desulfonatronum parangueonense]